MPLNEEASANKHGACIGTAILNLTDKNSTVEIRKAFPWYEDLHSIMGTNPALAATTISSHPGVDHTGSFLSLINSSASHRTRTHPPSTSNAQSTHPSNESITSGIQSTPSSTQHAPHPPLSQYSGTDMNTQHQGPPGSWYDHPSLPGAAQPLNYLPAGTSQSPQDPHQQLNYLPTGTSQSHQSHVFGAAQSPPQNTYPLGGAYSHPQAMTSHFRVVSPYSPNQPYGDGDYDPTPFDTHDIDDAADNEVQGDGYEMDETPADEPRVWDISLDSPPEIIGNQRQRPDPPSTSLLQAHSLSRPAFTLPQTSCTPVHDSRDSFRTPPNHVARRTSKPSSVASSSSSRSISTSSAPPSTSSPTTSRSSFPFSSKGRGSTANKRRSGIQGQVNDIQSQLAAFNAGIESVHLDKITALELKNERYIAKLNAHNQAEQRRMVSEQLSNERADAAIIHQRSQESKAAEIRLHEVEAETLCLKIEYYKLTNSGTSSSGQDSGP